MNLDQKLKIRKVMHEFKEGELNIGRSRKKVKKRKQAIAIALSEAGLPNKSRKTGLEVIKNRYA